MINISKILTLFHTVRHLKPIQVYQRIANQTNKNNYKKIDWKKSVNLSSSNLVLKESIQFENTYNNNSFEFLNLKKDFGVKVNWDFLDYGRLWTYNLNYFEYLNQQDITLTSGTELIEDFINQLPSSKVGLEPYPISLRCINWIKFFIRLGSTPKFDSILYKQLMLLTSKKEYHILGNHLLENGFSFLFGAYYFKNDNLYKEAKKILIPQLKEQVLEDGAHFELSPMYHSIMLFRILDCYNLVSNNDLFNSELEPLLRNKSVQMLSWLNKITFSNGKIPLLNDAAFKIAPEPKSLFDYALRLGLKFESEVNLGESGYRKLQNSKFEIVTDIGKIGPDYQPGHAHADTFNFELYVNGRPLIVDSGTSTYEINDVRFYERSTLAHNTVVINGENSSKVWSGHRVAKRAKVSILKDLSNLIIAVHDGYKKYNVFHKRTFQSYNNSDLGIIDEIQSKGVFYLHFAPNEDFQLYDNIIKGIDYKIEFIGVEKIELFESYYSPEFNKRINRKSVRVTFSNKLQTFFT